MIWPRPITFVNAVVLAANGRSWDSLRVRGGSIAALGSPPHRGDVVIDAEQAVISAGFINAHDHLELNSFGRLKWRARHQNVREWIADFQPRFTTDRALANARAETLSDRLWVGGLKNMLSGVTTVCHHNPLHRPLQRRFPVRLVRRYGLSHSLLIDGAGVRTSYLRTPVSWPWIVHAAEGIDAEARGEIDILTRWRCVDGNTVLVHGVAIDDTAAGRVLKAGSGLVWCPSSNDFLFGTTANVAPFDRARRLALGTDSRLSGEGDLLDELRAAALTGQVSPEGLLRTVTINASEMLRLPGAGRLSLGQPADLAVFERVAADPFVSLVSSTRRHVRLTMVGGAPLAGDRRMREVFVARRQPCVEARVDGRPTFIARWIARRVGRMLVAEPGVEVSA
jgi:cytosine/adenosine deaminase-related metal-dependent hydrolase